MTRTAFYLAYLFSFLFISNSLAQFNENHIIHENLDADISGLIYDDIDGDDYEDIIFKAENTFYWKKNLDGNGNFGLPTSIYELTVCCIRPFTFDFDNDGDKDILGFGYTSGWYSIILLENIDGLGNFSSPIFHFEEETPKPYYHLFIKDIDNDNDSDICLANGSGKFDWLENTGGNFIFLDNNIDDTAEFIDVDIKDLDNDGLEDIIAIERNIYSNPVVIEYSIVWYKNIGGSFLPKNTIYLTPQKLSKLYAQDIEQDSNTDIFCLVDEYLQGAIYLPAGIMYLEHTDESITFEEPVYLDNGNSYSEIQFNDIDKDDKLDILARNNNEIYWLEQKDSPLLFANSKTITNHGTANYFSGGHPIIIEDIDGDEDNDILTSRGYYGISWLENKKEENQISFDIGAYRLPNGGYDAQIADLDNDGDLDMMSIWVDELFLLKNDGAGIFTNQTFSLPSHTLAGDFNEFVDFDGDGDLDIILILSSEDELAYFENTDGQGNFGSHITIPLPISFSFSKMDMKDIDGDGNIDIIGSRFSQNEIYWLKNLGQNTFDSPLLIDDNNLEAWQFTMNDIDLDGDLDLISFKDNSIFWNENINSQDVFASRQKLVETTETINGLQIEDINNDDNKDIVVTHPKRLEVFHNTGNTYAPFSETEELNEFITFADFLMKDIDGDNDLDVFIRNLEDAWFENIDGQGTFVYRLFQRIPRTIQIGNNTFIQDLDNIIVVEDFDNDGDMDVLTDDFTIYDNSQAQVYFSGQHSINFEVSPDYLHAVDLDGDNDLEVISTSNNPLPSSHINVVCFENEETPDTIYFNQQHYIGGGYGQYHSEDIDLDGDADLIGINRNRDSLIVYENNGNYSFTPINLLGTDENPNDISFFFLFDIDNDGDSDILYSVLNTGLFVTENIGGFEFASSIPLVEDYFLDDFSNVPDNFSNFTINNFDANSIPDLLYILPTENELILLTDINKEGTYVDSIVFSNDRTNQVLSSDIDNDGDIDFLTRSEYFGEISWWENKGSHEFTENVISFEQGTELKYFDIGDIDSDNDIDIVYCHTDNQNGNIQRISLLENIDGFTQFDNPKFILDTINNIEFVHLKDFDLDSDLDVLYLAKRDGAAFSPKKNLIGWLENSIIDDEHKHISGTCFYDENDNGVLDTNEIGLSNISIKIEPEIDHQLTNLHGEYSSILPDGEYMVSFIHPDTNWVLSSDSSQYNIILNGVSSDDNNFGFVPIRDTSIFEVNLGSAPTRCGFTVPFWLSLNNRGTQFENRLIALEIDPLVTFETSIPNPDSVSLDAQILFWNINNFTPGQSELIKLFFQMPNADFIGEEIQQTVYSTTTLQDTIQTDTLVFTNTINCAYDPNDKLVEPDRLADENYTLFDEELKYTIRFQNTGTDTAFNVIIKDVLNPYLDISTLRVIAASHDYIVRLEEENNSVNFIFDNILLPDSTANEIESHGFVKFGIHSKEGLEENTLISNKAFIFFDFNPAIVTNTVQNTFVSNIPINISTSIIEPLCYGDSTGLIAIDVIEEIPPYSFEWNTLSNNLNILQNIPSGTYELTVTDNLGNTLEEVFELNQPSELSNDINAIAETSLGNNGIIEITTMGGIAPYFYDWEDFPNINANVLTNLTTGTYNVTITDANNCSQTESIFVDFETNTNSINYIQNLSITPNPTSGLIFIDLETNQSEEIQLNIFSALGKNVYKSDQVKQQHFQDRINVSNLASGVYFIQIQVGIHSIEKKVILVK